MLDWLWEIVVNEIGSAAVEGVVGSRKATRDAELDERTKRRAVFAVLLAAFALTIGVVAERPWLGVVAAAAILVGAVVRTLRRRGDDYTPRG